jgi:competence ComEA-like helix-hairpin-helix protein
MAKFYKNLKELFSFTHNERIAIAVLMIMLLIVFLYPYLATKTKTESDGFEEFKTLVDELERSAIEAESAKTLTHSNNTTRQTKTDTKFELFDFDPNTADENTFMRLGFSQKQAASIINYRSKGAQFKTAADFKKLYVVSDETFARLQAHIKIAAITANSQPETAEKPSTATENTATRNVVFIEINSADTAELKKLKGIGSYYARQIVDYRNKLGGFANIEQLKEIRGIDSERFALFEKQAKANSSLIKKLNINNCTVKELAQHPYIGNYFARGIEQYRNIAGEIENLQQLINEKVITSQQAEKLRDYINF